MGLLEKFKNTQIYLENYSEKLKKLLKLEIERSRSRSYVSGSYNSPINTTGSLANSLSLLEKITPNKLSYQIIGNDYALNLNEGKPQAKMPNVGGIIKWIKDKRITLADIKSGEIISLSDVNQVQRIAYLIARKIGGDKNSIGTPETAGFIDKAIEDSMVDLDNLGNQVGKDVSLNIEDILLKAGYIKKGENYEYKFES